MSFRDWLKVILLVLIPINAWLGVLFYQKWKWYRMWWEGLQREQEAMRLSVQYHQKRLFRLREGMVLQFPFPNVPIHRIVGSFPPIGRGVPVLLLNISWIAEYEVWEPAISEALKASPNLHIALLYSVEFSRRREEGERLFRHAVDFWKKINNPRVSLLASEDWYKVVGHTQGTLLILCDERGVIRKIEPYPDLKLSPYWSEEVADWRPKLHQAVKKVLDEFFPKRSP